MLEEEVEIVVARAAEGDIGILHGHEPVISPLGPGELMYRVDGQEYHMAVAGGFLEVTEDKVVVLADTAERSEEIDLQRAEESRQRAEEAVRQHQGSQLEAEAMASLQKALLRLRVAERRRHHERPAPRLEG